MNAWLNDFESIGDNREFGFVQRKLGVDRNALLRWAVMDDLDAATTGIRGGFSGVFAFDNLRPAGGNMARDVTVGIAFPTAMRSELCDGIWRFRASDMENRRIHAEELRELTALRHSFSVGLIGGSRLYVATSRADLTKADAAELFAALAAHGGRRLLVVTVSDAHHPPATVEALDAGIAHGRIDRFAPDGQPEDVSLECWKTVLRNAAALFGSPDLPASRPRPTRRLPLADKPDAGRPGIGVHAADYFSPPMRALGARLRDSEANRYLPMPCLPWQLDEVRRLFAPAFYARLLDRPANDPAALWEHYQAHGLPAGIPPTPLFDHVQYRREMIERGLPPPLLGEPLVLHWLREGAEARIVPSRVFDEAFYMATNPDVARTAPLGFRHFLLGGIAESRAPTIWFDLGWYAARGGPGERYDHFIATGIHEGRLPGPLVAEIMRMFAHGADLTPDIYISLVEASLGWRGQIAPDAVQLLIDLYVPEWHGTSAAPLDGFIRYLRHGLPAGLRPGPLFDAAVYRQRAAAAALPPLWHGESPVEHWLRHGHPARIVPTERFDEASYLARYPNVASTGMWGFAHFLRSGLAEGNRPSDAPMLLSRVPIVEPADDTMPALLRTWHRHDFPDDPSAIGGEIPAAMLRRFEDTLRSPWLAEIFAEARAIEPAVGELSTITEFRLSPYHDQMALRHAEIRRRLPATHYDSVVCVPWILTGGADLVAGLLAKALMRVRPDEKLLILRTDQPNFERPDWLPANVDIVDISDQTAAVPPDYAEELLRALLRGVTARRVFSVNSRLCWNTLRDHGHNIAATLRSYGYLFCCEQTPTGAKYGYPADYFAETAATVTAFLTDTHALRDELTATYRLPEATRDRIVPILTPAQTAIRTPSIARIVEQRDEPGSRKLVLWAGRLDRQKRFDLVRDIAALMPDVTFRCWGAPLLDAPPDLSDLPGNLHMEGSFASFDDLPLAEAGVWLFTALWEGMPTTIIELAVRGVAIVASAVGGIPELIQPDTGWPVAADAGVADYVANLREALASPAEATRRAEALQRRAGDIHTEAAYDATLRRLLDAEDTQ